MQSLRERMRRLVALLSLVIAGACGNPTGPKDIVGTYFLRTVGGSPLPVTAWQSSTEKLEWTGGSLSLRTNHSFSGSITSRLTVGSQVTGATMGLAGTWQENGLEVTISCCCDQGTSAGSISGHTLTIADGDRTLVYVRLW